MDDLADPMLPSTARSWATRVTGRRPYTFVSGPNMNGFFTWISAHCYAVGGLWPLTDTPPMMMDTVVEYEMTVVVLWKSLASVTRLGLTTAALKGPRKAMNET